MTPTVFVPHTEEGLRPEVKEEIERQGFGCMTFITPSGDRFAYATWLRDWWRLPLEFILCEQDVVPPPDALERLTRCPAPWCSHPHWAGDHHVVTTTGLVRWSLGLRQRFPWLMDSVCAALEPRYWVRRGWTKLPRDCSPEVLNSAGRRACLQPGAPAKATDPDLRRRPTSHDWKGIDSDLAYQLNGLGVTVHVHPDPTIHLHDFSRDPKPKVWRWWDEEYNPADWERFGEVG